jgi:hypothetical protein
LRVAEGAGLLLSTLFLIRFFMKEKYNDRFIIGGPTKVGVGRFRYEMFAIESKGVSIDGNVIKFLASRQFKYVKEEIRGLGYVTPRSLGFDDSVSFESILKKTKSMELNECPMETAINLSELIVSNRQNLEKGVDYYVVSEKQGVETGFGEKAVPDYLRVKVSGEGRIAITGWNNGDTIPLDGRVVFAVKET